MIQGRTNGELGIESRSWIGIGSKNRTGVQSSELLHEVVTLSFDASPPDVPLSSIWADGDSEGPEGSDWTEGSSEGTIYVDFRLRKHT